MCSKSLVEAEAEMHRRIDFFLSWEAKRTEEAAKRGFDPWMKDRRGNPAPWKSSEFALELGERKAWSEVEAAVAMRGWRRGGVREKPKLSQVAAILSSVSDPISYRIRIRIQNPLMLSNFRIEP